MNDCKHEKTTILDTTDVQWDEAFGRVVATEILECEECGSTLTVRTVYKTEILSEEIIEVEP